MRSIGLRYAAVVAALSLSLSSCITLGTAKPSASIQKPTFDNSHAILIEKTVKGLDIGNFARNKVRTGEKLIVTSLEYSDKITDQDYNNIQDWDMTSLVEDTFIAKLSSAGLRVFERDRDMLDRLKREQGDKYDAYALERYPNHPVFTLMRKLEERGLDYLNPSVLRKAADSVLGAEEARVVVEMSPLDLEKTMKFYASLEDQYASLTKATVDSVKMAAADVILSYRVLECGIVWDLDNKKVKADNGAELWRYSYKRHALARIYVRIVDAKTGEIRTADTLENANDDEIVFNQGSEETEAAFLERMSEYDKLLETYHFKFFDQQRPILRGGAATVVVGSKAQSGDAAQGGAVAQAAPNQAGAADLNAGAAAGTPQSAQARAKAGAPNANVGGVIAAATLGGLALVLLIVLLATSSSSSSY